MPKEVVEINIYAQIILSFFLVAYGIKVAVFKSIWIQLLIERALTVLVKVLNAIP